MADSANIIICAIDHRILNFKIPKKRLLKNFSVLLHSLFVLILRKDL